MTPPPFIVFTDLDGTLLDHETYSWAPALPALSMLRARGVPVVLASSKTAAEIAPLRDEMRLSHCPAIVENGAGILPAGAGPEDAGADYARIRAALDAVPADLRAGFTGFGDWDADEIARQTGLPPETAALARRRAFSEPGVWSGPAARRAEFLAALESRGISARRGGRFLTLGFGGTKADRMAEIAEALGGGLTVALGDAPNDVEMLETAGRGFIIPNADAPEMPILAGERDGRIRRATKPGPAGWNEVMLTLLSDATGRDPD